MAVFHKKIFYEYLTICKIKTTGANYGPVVLVNLKS